MDEKKLNKFEYKKDDEFFRTYIDSDSGKTVIKLKTKDNEQILTYSITGGILFVPPVTTNSVYNSMVHYSFYEYIFKFTKAIKIIMFIADNILYKVPFDKFMELGYVVESTDSINKKIFIPRINLLEFKVKKFITM